MTAAFPGYTYNGVIVAVHDGDTCTIDLSLGFWVTVRMACRLAGLNAIELSQPGGPEAGAYLMSLIPPGTPVTVRSVKPDKYAGRFDGVIWAGAVNVNEQMITAGFAVAWDGTGPKPVPPGAPQ